MVLYLSYDGLLDPLGQSQILPYLKGLSKRYPVTLITFEKKSTPEEEYSRMLTELKDFDIRWMPERYHKSPPVISTLWDLLVLQRKVSSLVRTESIKLIHCRSYITALVGLSMKKRHHVPFLFDMRGFWADERVEGGIWKLSNPLFKIIYSFFKRKEKECIAVADAVVVLTHAAKKEISTWTNQKEIHVIPCCVDDALFDPEKYSRQNRDQVRKSLEMGAEDFVLLYLGSLGTWYLTSEMLTFFRQLQLLKPDAKLLILTPDKLPPGDHPKGIIIRRANRRDVPSYLSIADGSVFFIKPSYSKKGSSATKMGELMAMNVPFVTNRNWGDVEAILQEVPAGILVDSFKAEDLHRAAEALLMHNAAGARSKALNYFSLNHGIDAYGVIYSSILGRTTA